MHMLHIHHLAESVSPSVGMVCKAGHGYGCKCSACGRKGAKQAVARALQEMVKWEHPIGRFGREAQELAANLPQKRELLVDSKDESAQKRNRSQYRHMRHAQIFTLVVCVLTYKQTQWGLCSASRAKSRMSNSSPKSRNRWLPCWNSRTSMMRAGSKKACTRTCQRDWIRRTASSWDLPFHDILLLAKQHVFFVFCCWTSAAGDYCRSCTKLSVSLTTMRMFQRSQKMAFSLWSIQQSQYVLAFHWNFWHFWHWVFDWLGSQYKRKSWSVRRWGSGKMKEATKIRLGLTLIFLGAMLQVVIEALPEKPRNVYRIVAASRMASWVECNLSRFYFECVPRISRSQWLQWKIICLSWPVTSCHWLAVILRKTRHSRRSAQLLECHFPCCRVCCNSQRSIGIARRMQGAVRVCLLQSNTVG